MLRVLGCEASFSPAAFTLTIVIYASPPFYLFPFQYRVKCVSALVFPEQPLLGVYDRDESVPLPAVPYPFRTPAVSPTHPRVLLACDLSPYEASAISSIS